MLATIIRKWVKIKSQTIKKESLNNGTNVLNVMHYILARSVNRCYHTDHTKLPTALNQRKIIINT